MLFSQMAKKGAIRLLKDEEKTCGLTGSSSKTNYLSNRSQIFYIYVAIS